MLNFCNDFLHSELNHEPGDFGDQLVFWFERQNKSGKFEQHARFVLPLRNIWEGNHYDVSALNRMYHTYDAESLGTRLLPFTTAHHNALNPMDVLSGMWPIKLRVDKPRLWLVLKEEK